MSVTVYVLGKDGRRYRLRVRGEFYTPGPIPVQTLAGFSIERDEVFEGGRRLKILTKTEGNSSYQYYPPR
ncbi:MAG: hypothetical protein WKG07_27540 [Hymenobacter sp.]